MKITGTLLILLNLFALNTFAQEYTQWGLPEGATARLGKGIISGNIACSPAGTRLAVVSSIGIWLYDTATYHEVALLTGHTDGVNSVAVSSDGNTLASGHSDSTVRLWDVDAGTHTRTLTGHTRAVNSVAFSPDGNTIASGSEDWTVRLWDVDTGANTHNLTGHLGGVYSIAFSPDGNTLASGSSDGTILPWALTPSTPLSVEPSILKATPFGPIKRNALLQNFPNPFNPETWIPYSLAHDAPVNIGIYDIRGQLVRQIGLGQQPAGSYLNRETAAYWDGKDQFGEAVSSGVYFYTLKAGTFQATRRMVILK